MNKSKWPEWLNEAIFYEIYPQSFKDTNADGIGDFQGIIDKLDYILELGCNAIWMNPCFDSPFGDAGYDVADYCKAAPRYGTNEDLVRLFNEAHKRGMHVLLDLVPGHTSTKHKWFIESTKAEKNEYTDRYVWTDSVWESPGDMACIRGISDRDGSCAVNFFSHQPALNYGYYLIDKPWQQSMDSEGPKATLEAMKNVMRFWLKLGCDGFRVDMASSLVKNDPDSIGIIRLWQNVRAFLNEEFPNAVMVSEWGQPDKSITGGFHMDFLLHFGPSHYYDLFRGEKPFFSSAGEGEIGEFVEYYNMITEKAAGNGMICFISGNHDMERLAWKLSGNELKVAFAFILSLPGAPYIYYGDEIGMRYLEGLTSVEGGYFRTGARSPMQWDDSTNAGFSSAPEEQLYICIDPSNDRPTVEKGIEDNDSLWHQVHDLIKFRKENEALHNASKIEFTKVGYPLVYQRTGLKQSITVIINPSEKQAEVEIMPGRIIYSVGCGGQLREDKCIIKGCSAVFIEND